MQLMVAGRPGAGELAATLLAAHVLQWYGLGMSPKTDVHSDWHGAYG